MTKTLQKMLQKIIKQTLKGIKPPPKPRSYGIWSRMTLSNRLDYCIDTPDPSIIIKIIVTLDQIKIIKIYNPYATIQINPTLSAKDFRKANYILEVPKIKTHTLATLDLKTPNSLEQANQIIKKVFKDHGHTNSHRTGNRTKLH